MPNQEQLKNTEDHIEQKELKSNIEQSRTRSYYSNYIGSHILALVNFQNSKHAKDNVQHYFNEYNKKIKKQNQTPIEDRPAKTIEKYPSNNSQERRNFAYLERLTCAVNKYGDRIEKRLWDKTIKNENLFINWEDISSSSWDYFESEFHEKNEQDNLPKKEYTIEEKQADFKKRRQAQINSLEEWINYFTDESAPDYPLWFKIYTFNGITQMGQYNADLKKYTNRDKTTIALYPTIDQGALAMVFDAITAFYGEDKEFWLTKNRHDSQLISLVKSGNFNNLYSRYYTEINKGIPTPEKSEDVHGKWFEYLPGDEKEIADSAKTTPWCVKSPVLARHYLRTNSEIKNNQAKFKLFKLEDNSSESGYSKTACASIRIGIKGDIMEISGLNEGQALEDSLVPFVKEQAMQCPGYEKFATKFQDKEKLILLMNKMRNKQAPTFEELCFLYETSQNKITTLDIYNDIDPKITPLREYFNLNYILDNFLQDTEDLKQEISPFLKNSTDKSIVDSFTKLREAGFHQDEILAQISTDGFSNHLVDMLKRNIPTTVLLEKLPPSGYSYNFSVLRNNFLSSKELLEHMDEDGISTHFYNLIKDGIPINDIIEKMGSSGISRHYRYLIRNNFSIKFLMDKMNILDVSRRFNDLINIIPAEELIEKITNSTVAKYYYKLSDKLSSETILNHLNPEDVAKHFDNLNKTVSLDEIAKHLGRDGVAQYYDKLIGRVSTNTLVERMDPQNISIYFDQLLKYGADLECIAKAIYDVNILSTHLDSLLAKGTNTDIINENIYSDLFDKYTNAIIEQNPELDIDNFFASVEEGTLDLFAEKNGYTGVIDQIINEEYPQKIKEFLKSQNINQNLTFKKVYEKQLQECNFAE